MGLEKLSQKKWIERNGMHVRTLKSHTNRVYRHTHKCTVHCAHTQVHCVAVAHARPEVDVIPPTIIASFSLLLQSPCISDKHTKEHPHENILIFKMIFDLIAAHTFWHLYLL